MPEQEIDPITTNAVTHVMEVITERVLAVCAHLSAFPEDDPRRDQLAPMLRRWSSEIHGFEEGLEEEVFS